MEPKNEAISPTWSPKPWNEAQERSNQLNLVVKALEWSPRTKQRVQLGSQNPIKKFIETKLLYTNISRSILIVFFAYENISLMT
ncbi:hypothetical protein ABEP00_10560 [Heyndrickxia sporothermodurans]